MTFTSCADDFHWVYFDGKLAASNAYPNQCCQEVKATMPANTQVVAVKVSNGNGAGGAGWRGYFSDGVMSDSDNWKCTKATIGSTELSWTLPGYDDGGWWHPTSKMNYWGPCPYNSAYPANARWLWLNLEGSFTDNAYVTIYCRRNIGESFSKSLILIIIIPVVLIFYFARLVGISID